MDHKTANANSRFSTLEGLASIGQVWPSGCYEEYLPAQYHVSIASYWGAVGEYLNQAETQVRSNLKS